jgi:hypothetical protein
MPSVCVILGWSPSAPASHTALPPPLLTPPSSPHRARTPLPHRLTSPVPDPCRRRADSAVAAQSSRCRNDQVVAMPINHRQIHSLQHRQQRSHHSCLSACRIRWCGLVLGSLCEAFNLIASTYRPSTSERQPLRRTRLLLRALQITIAMLMVKPSLTLPPPRLGLCRHDQAVVAFTWLSPYSGRRPPPRLRRPRPPRPRLPRYQRAIICMWYSPVSTPVTAYVPSWRCIFSLFSSLTVYSAPAVTAWGC